MAEDNKVIEVKDLRKVYPGEIKAVDGVSFAVAKNEIYGLLGPNGAGKTTIIMVLTTLLKPTAGEAYVNGYNVATQKNRVRLSLGYVSQDLAVDDELTGWDNLRLQAGLFNLNGGIRRGRMEEALRLVDLQDRAHSRVNTYSGGMRKRLDIACGLIHRPEVLFLDEPTLGLDIQTRHEIWHYITSLQKEAGITILLTSHYMNEVEELCDRIAIIDRGKLVTEDTPENLKTGLGGDLIFFAFTAEVAEEEEKRALAKLEECSFIKEISRKDEDYIAITYNGEEALPRFFAALEGLPVQLQKVTLKKPSLDDVFLHYTGRDLRDGDSSKEEVLRTRATLERMRRR